MTANYIPVTLGITEEQDPIWSSFTSEGELRLYYSQQRKSYELFIRAPSDGHNHPVATFNLHGFQTSWRKATESPRLTVAETRLALHEIEEIIRMSSVHYM